jgi:FLVCR family MFS transporter 7
LATDPYINAGVRQFKMAPHPEISQQGNATEKQTNIQSSQENKTEATANDQAAPEAAPGGWTFLQAMKMRGLKGRGSASAAASPPLSTSSNVSNGKSKDNKDNDELKVAQTNDSGDGPRGIGEIDVLHEVRSDDGLLGDEGGSAPQHAGTQGNGNNGRENVEETGGRVYKVYKRRWFGLVQLALLNIIVSWDVSRLSKSSQPPSVTNATLSGSLSPPTQQRPRNTTM